MPNSIEIFQNTLLQLIVRQGLDSDRLNIVLKQGELGYTTDTKRLYAGDGVTAGGILIGNVFKGSVVDVTAITDTVIGDYAYDSDNKKLYIKDTVSTWLEVGGVYSAGDTSISIDSNNNITVGLLSGNNLDPSIVENPIYITGTNKIALSSEITVDRIYPRNATALTLFPSLSVNGIKYNFPSTAPVAGSFMKILNTNYDVTFAPISASEISTKTVTVTFPLTSTANGVASTGTAVNPLTADIVIGLSPLLSSRSLWARSLAAGTMLSNKGISAVSRTSQGHYTFTYDNTLPTSNPFAMVQIIGSAARGYQARIVSVTDEECFVEVTNLDNHFLFTDADLALNIEV